MICDDDGTQLPIGDLGEICIKGPQVMKGYWNRPEETKKSMESGNLDAFLKGMGTPRGNVDTSFLPL